MMRSRLLVLPPLLAMTACALPDETPAGFGDAVHHNMAVQMVNPAPAAAAAAEQPDNDGARAGRAMQRYQEFKVFPPVTPVATGASTGAEQK